MLEEKIINDYISILNNLERGKKSNLDDLINSILINKYHLERYYTNSTLAYDSVLE